MKKSGDSSQFPLGRRMPNDRTKDQPSKPDTPSRKNTPNPMQNPVEALEEKRNRRSRRRPKKDVQKKGFLDFLLKIRQKTQSTDQPAVQPTTKLTGKAVAKLTSKLTGKAVAKPAGKKTIAKSSLQLPTQPSSPPATQAIEFPRKSKPIPKGSRLEELRSKRHERAPRKHALFSPPINPINFPRPRNRSQVALLYALRLLILGVGLGVISGTVMSIWDPAMHWTAGANAPVEPSSPREERQQQESLTFGQELTPLKAKIQALIAQNPKLAPTVFLMDLDTHAYVDIGMSEVSAAASTIKLPIVIAFFQDVDQGKVQLDQLLSMRKDLVAPESGEMQYQPIGSKFSAIKTVTEMITISDNTATNMVIDLLGGPDALNQRFKSWGLTSTMIRNALPDIAGTNTTSGRDMGEMLSQLSQGKLMSSKSRDRLLDLLRNVEGKSLLPRGLGEGATIAHKTGTIGSLLADVGLIDTATGHRYVASVLVKRPHDDDRAILLIQQISKLSYQTFNQQPNTATSPSIDKNSPQDESLERSKVSQP